MDGRVVVAGAGFAGLNSALMLDSRGFEVVLVERKSFHVFRPGLTELVRGRVSEERIKLDLEDFLEGTGIDYVKEEIRGVDPDEKVLSLGSGDYSYDYLVLALGSERIEPDFDLKYAEDFYNLEDAQDAIKDLEESDSAVVIGSGYTGVEIGTELHEKGVDVTIVDRATRPMPNSNEEASHKALEYFNEEEVSFMGGKEVEEVTNYGVEFRDGSELEADTVVWCGGLQASETVQESFGTGAGGVKVNNGLSAVDYEDVFVAGDAADDDFVDTAQIAEKEGVHVAKNIYSGSELLSEFSPGRNPILVSLGNSGMLVTEDSVYESRFFRYLKDLVIRYYFFNVKRRKLKSRFSLVKSSFSLLDIMGK
ncbi:MAG: NAD(P)/FAD-dependent oxidoreductase [Candidatus Nanosalina sp.]